MKIPYYFMPYQSLGKKDERIVKEEEKEEREENIDIDEEEEEKEETSYQQRPS